MEVQMVEFDLLSHMTFAETPDFLSEGSSRQAVI